MISGSKRTLSLNNLKILRPKVTKNLTKDTFYSDNYLEKHFSFSFQSGVNVDFGIFMFAFSANIEYKKIAYQVN